MFIQEPSISTFADDSAKFNGDCSLGEACIDFFEVIADFIGMGDRFRSLVGRDIAPLSTEKIRENVDRELCGEALQLGPKDWAAKVIEKFGIVKGKNCFETVIKLDIPLLVKIGDETVDGHTYYSELQNQLSVLKKGEDDNHKPTIDLTLYGEDTTISDASDFAILGGVGCLADADLLHQTVHQLKAKPSTDFSRLKISLYSIPPPRNIEDMKFAPLYFAKAVKRLNKKAKRFYIASNTAHLNFDILNAMGSRKGVNLVERVAKKLQEDPKTRVLIVGTTQAYKGKLYPKVLDKVGVSYQVMETLKEQTIIQDGIDQQKHGEMTPEESAKVFNAIADRAYQLAIKGTPVNKILFGCTELPAIFENREGFSNLGIVVDSQALFAECIADDLDQPPRKDLSTVEKMKLLNPSLVA